jgi:tetratricopeptide (TPR) repeat protein
MENQFRLHTPEELTQIAENNFERFKEIAKYYYDNDFQFFEDSILPILEKHKQKNFDVNSDNDKTIKIENDNKFNEQKTDIGTYLPEQKVKSKSEIYKKKRKLFIYGISSLILVSMALLLYYFLIYNNSYRQGMTFLKNKDYSQALEKFSEIDSTSHSYVQLQSAINFAKASKYFEEQNYKDAIIYFKKVDANSDFYEETKLNIDKITNDPNIIYVKAINHINAKEYDDALNELRRVKPSDLHYSQAQSKIYYVRGVIEYNLNNYSDADTYFKNVEKTDEFYQDIISKKSKIENYLTSQKDNEANKDYARTLIRLADEIEDQHQLCTNASWIYYKNTYVPTLINLRSELNSTYYGASNKSLVLKDFKSMILKWVNSYIDFAESIGTYGNYTNYDADRMWASYGYTLYSKRDLGDELHKKVVKQYLSIKSQFGLN